MYSGLRANKWLSVFGHVLCHNIVMVFSRNNTAEQTQHFIFLWDAFFSMCSRTEATASSFYRISKPFKRKGDAFNASNQGVFEVLKLTVSLEKQEGQKKR